MPEQGYKKYAGQYPADKVERAKYDRGESYRGADGKTYSGKKGGSDKPLKEVIRKKFPATKVLDEPIRGLKAPAKKIEQPDERVGIAEKVEARRKEKKASSLSGKELIHHDDWFAANPDKKGDFDAYEEYNKNWIKSNPVKARAWIGDRKDRQYMLKYLK